MSGGIRQQIGAASEARQRLITSDGAHSADTDHRVLPSAASISSSAVRRIRATAGQMTFLRRAPSQERNPTEAALDNKLILAQSNIY